MQLPSELAPQFWGSIPSEAVDRGDISPDEIIRRGRQFMAEREVSQQTPDNISGRLVMAAGELAVRPLAI